MQQELSADPGPYREEKPPAWHQGKQKRVRTYSHISAGARLSLQKLTSSSLEKRDSVRSVPLQ